MSKPFTVCAGIFLAGVLSMGIQSVAAADTVVVTADRMIDVIGGRVVDHPQVTITDGRISAVGTTNAAVPAGARRVALPGMTLLPGLIDMHTHITGDPRYGGWRSRRRCAGPGRAELNHGRKSSHDSESA